MMGSRNEAEAIVATISPFLACALLFVALQPASSWYAVVLKCLPIYCLCSIVLHNIRVSYSLHGRVPRYDAAILMGLLLSSIGDASLVFIRTDKVFFITGLLFFAMAHICYVYAFGWVRNQVPLKGAILSRCVLLAVIAYAFVYLGAAEEGLAMLSSLYLLLLTVMGWRALARLEFFDDRWTWTKLAAVLGAISFCFSDFVLALNKFTTPVPAAQTIIMVTYYLGQLGISLSVLGPDEEK